MLCFLLGIIIAKLSFLYHWSGLSTLNIIGVSFIQFYQSFIAPTPSAMTCPDNNGALSCVAPS